MAAQVIGLEAAFDEDGCACLQINAQVGFERLFGPQVAGDGFETMPDDSFREVPSRADVPDETVGDFGRAEEFGESKFGFAGAAAGDGLLGSAWWNRRLRIDAAVDGV